MLLVRLVREPTHAVDDPPPAAAAEAQSPEERALPRAFWHVLTPLVLFGLVNSSDALLLQHAGDVGLGVTEVVGVYVAYNVVYALLGYPAGRLADRVPHRFLLAGGLVVFAVVYLGLGLVHDAGAVWVLLPLYGAFTACTEGVSRAWIADLVPGAPRTWALGVHGAATGVAVLIAGLWSGLAWGDDGRVPLAISGAVALVAAVWIASDARGDVHRAALSAAALRRARRSRSS